MPIRSRFVWGFKDIPFSDPRLWEFPALVRDFRAGRLPPGWRGNRVFENWSNDLPPRHYGYYTEFYVGTSAESGSLRVVLGANGEVYITGNHYTDFRQVLQLPS